MYVCFCVSLCFLYVFPAIAFKSHFIPATFVLKQIYFYTQITRDFQYNFCFVLIFHAIAIKSPVCLDDGYWSQNGALYSINVDVDVVNISRHTSASQLLFHIRYIYLNRRLIWTHSQPPTHHQINLNHSLPYDFSIVY